MTVVDAWNAWPLWRWLVWAALGFTALAFAIPGPTPQPQAAISLPPLPVPTYQPTALAAPAVVPQAAPPAAKRPKSVPAVPLPVEAETALPARPLLIPEGLPQPIPERQPGTYSADPRLLKPRPLVTP